MIETLQIRNIYPSHASFNFTPEGYSKASYWMPNDAFTWDDFRNQSFKLSDDIKLKASEFEAANAGKLEVTNALYWEKSLRQLLPDRWTFAYSKDRAWKVLNGKKVPLYSQLKRTLYFKSIILGYGDGPIQKSIPNGDRAVARYIKEHCASSARLKAISLRAYESVANTRGHHTWTSMSPSIFLCLAAAKSSLDALSAVLWALIFHETPTGRDLPSIATLLRALDKKRHPFHAQFSKLYKSWWVSRLQLARDKVIHRSASPITHDNFGAGFDFDLGLFKEMPRVSRNLGKPRVGMEKNIKLIHLDRIMKGFVIGLEKWEQSMARKLKTHQWYKSFNTNGILLGVDFDDQNLMRDGSGPTTMLKSYPVISGPKPAPSRLRRPRKSP